MQAMIFCAGLGTRFKPWTDKHPKALALVNGKSLLQRNIEYFQQFGISDIIVNVHHFADQIIDAIQTNKGWGSNVTVSDETNEVLETGGGLAKARKYFDPGQRFVTTNVDILTDLDLNALLDFHQQEQSLISFGVTDRKTSRYFLFDEKHRLCGWRNVNTHEETIVLDRQSLIQKAYSCVAVFQPEIFSLIPSNGKYSLKDSYLELAAKHRIMGFDHSGDKLVDVGKPESIRIGEELFP